MLLEDGASDREEAKEESCQDKEKTREESPQATEEAKGESPEAASSTAAKPASTSTSGEVELVQVMASSSQAHSRRVGHYLNTLLATVCPKEIRGLKKIPALVPQGRKRLPGFMFMSVEDADKEPVREKLRPAFPGCFTVFVVKALEECEDPSCSGEGDPLCSTCQWALSTPQISIEKRKVPPSDIVILGQPHPAPSGSCPTPSSQQ